MMRRFIFFILLSLIVFFSEICSSQIYYSKNHFDLEQKKSFFHKKSIDLNSNRKTESINKDNFNLLFGFGGCYFILPYAEIGFNYKKLYFTGEICYLVLGGYLGLCGQYEFFTRGKYFLLITANYGIFGGVGILDPTYILGVGLECRYGISKSRAHVFGRLSLQSSFIKSISKNSRNTTIPVLQFGILLKI